MDFLRVNLDIKNLPELDPEFIPLHKFNEAFLRGAEKPVGIALERAGGEMAAKAGVCRALNAPTPAPPMAPAASSAATRRVLLETVDVMGKLLSGKARIGADADKYQDAGLDET